MRQISSLALLNAVHSLTVAAAGSLPRGVSPEFAEHYQDKEEFSCITDASIKLSIDRINDNTCDCPDGSDEPGTAACALLDPLSPEQPFPGFSARSTKRTPAIPGFWCENKGHIGAYVPFAFVNDGVCDYELCCDGTEEFGGRTKCENKCTSIGKEYRRLEAEKKAKLERAGKKRLIMANEAAELRRRLESQWYTLTDEVKALDIKVADLKKKYEEVELQEKTKVVMTGGSGGPGGKLGVLVGVAKARVEELRNTLDSVLRQRDTYKARAEELETILAKLKRGYNPNFNDEGVKSAVKSYEDYAARDGTDTALDSTPDSSILEVLKADGEASGINWKEFETGDAQDDTDILYDWQAYLPGFLRTIVNDKLTGLRVWLIQNGMLSAGGTPGSESDLTKAAREAKEAAEKELKKKNKDLEKTTSDLSTYYGPDDIFRALKDQCISTDSGEYTYELCWLGRTSQKSKKGHGNTGMGSFERIDFEIADEEERLDGRSLGKGQRMVMRYENGQACWNGPKRRTDVWIGCAETDELWRISEMEKCVYRMEVGTPAACEPAADGQKPAGKDEL
ncbi:protein kinase C substrate 80K-H [Geosmithia morbida]|uniref:Glucosidase 2 subunit beta n=1 Tax=Geosmithia morbida TaxID=1094350 RepID=A0A9P4YV09_9HYPO|nr:protein kinase C substrate 80K-H [Geosmithia morbida]KAF4122216.1 protein kinase C substrate 80K-H [Geosmithia morbida]